MNNIFNHKFTKRLNFSLETNSKIQLLLSEIDNYKGQWTGSLKVSNKYLKMLSQSIIASSTAASTRIEGSKLTDNEVETLLKEGKLRKVLTRDQQEVAGYIEVLESVFVDYSSLQFSERVIKEVHSIILKYTQKDAKYRGVYKTQSNQVVAVDAHNHVIGVLFDPATVEETPKMMIELIDWTLNAFDSNSLHPLLIIASFVFEFLSIHPFKDGNGRVSRVLTNLLLLQNGYEFTKYVSQEALIEEVKNEYYLSLRLSSKNWNTDLEDISHWILFMLDIIRKQAVKSSDIRANESLDFTLNEVQTIIWNLFLEESILSRKIINEKTSIPLSTIEHVLRKLISINKITAHGEGRSRSYRINIS